MGDRSGAEAQDESQASVAVRQATREPHVVPLLPLGYPEISAGRNFKVRIERKGADPLEKQIDVLARDDETVVVAECKACAKPDRRSLQKDIEEFANLKGPIAQAIHRHYGEEFKPKIIWLFVTDNIFSWHDQVRLAACLEKATQRGVRVVASNADSPSILSLYSGPGWVHVQVSRQARLAASSANRRLTTEIVVSNCLTEDGLQAEPRECRTVE